MVSLSEIKITPRDEQVLKLLVEGCSNKEIASQLNISPRTVKAASAHAVSAGWNPGRSQSASSWRLQCIRESRRRYATA